MTMNPLPPQAYTKDILLKAYQWLMGQNGSIKEMATTPDILVSLYLKATRDGDHALDRPSIQNFKNELRSLAGMMGELDRTPATHSQPVPQPTSHPTVQTAVQTAPAVSVQQQPLQQMLTPQMTTASAMPSAAPKAPAQTMTASAPVTTVMSAPSMSMPVPTQTQVSYTEKTMTTTTRPSDPLEALDCATKLMIQEVKEEFNLSSDLESLRMLVKIGYSRSRSMLS